MSIQKFLDPDNKNYQIQVIAPTHTYGMMKSLDSKYDFEIDYDEYDPEGLWAFNVIVNNEVIAAFNNLEDVREYLGKD